MKPICTLAALSVLTALLAPSAASADVLVLNNGKSMKGIVEEQPSDPNSVTFIGALGKQKIPKDRIKSIDKEPPAQGYIHIGDEYMRLEKPNEALQAFNQALQADPNSEAAKQKRAAAQEAIDRIQMNRRQDDIQEIEAIKGQVLDLIRQKQFERAEETLKKASDLKPTEAQKKELQQLVGDVYFAWAQERLDKLDRGGAEEKLNLALAATPNNDQVIQALLQLWENQPDKKDQLLRIYETVLARKPDDNAMRLKVADLQYESGNVEEAAVNYLKLYNSSDRFQGTALETRLREALDRLHMQYAQKQDFDQAMLYFNMLAKIDPNVDHSILRYYEYMKRASAVKGDDVEGRLGLARYAEQNLLHDVAIQNYRRVLELDPENEVARAAINRYALDIITEAKQAYAKQDYYLAKTLALTAKEDFPESKEAVLTADQIIGQSNNEIIRDQRQKRDLAREYVQRGDTCYQQALVFYRDIFNQEVSGSTALLSTPKADAIRHFKCAIAAYETAIKIDPSVGNDPSALITYNLQQSRAYLARLTQPPPQLGFRQSLRPTR